MDPVDSGNKPPTTTVYEGATAAHSVCLKCGGLAQAEPYVLLSVPPQTAYHCRSCHHRWSEYVYGGFNFGPMPAGELQPAPKSEGKPGLKEKFEANAASKLKFVLTHLENVLGSGWDEATAEEIRSYLKSMLRGVL